MAEAWKRHTDISIVKRRRSHRYNFIVNWGFKTKMQNDAITLSSEVFQIVERKYLTHFASIFSMIMMINVYIGETMFLECFLSEQKVPCHRFSLEFI